jgi:hypothetical protein
LFVGVGGYVLIGNAILSVDVSTWTFTGHEIAAAILPAINYIWLTAFLCMFIYTVVRLQK